MVDGRVARATSQVTRFGGFFDSVLDRYSDLALYIGLLVYYASINRFFYIVLTAIVMMGSVMISYTRARAENAIPKCKVGFLERPERVVLIIIGALFDRMAAVLMGDRGTLERHRGPPHDLHLPAGQTAGRRPTALAGPPRVDRPRPAQSSKITCAIPSSLVCVNESETFFTPNFSANFAATPCNRSVGFPLGRFATSKSCQRDSAPPTRPDRLHARFLGGEARRIPFELIRLALHIRDLPRRVDTLDELLPEALDRCLYARDLRQIHSRADNHLSSCPVVVMVSRPCFTPFVLISTSATFRTTADLPRTTSTSRQLS